jgi:hypothetical protein
VTVPSGGASAVLDAAVLQSVVGGSTVAVLLALLATGLLVVLSLVVAYEAIRGYGDADDHALGSLAAGIVLVSAGPTVLSLVLTNLTATPGEVVSLLQRLAELFGLLAIVHAMYYDG